MENNLKDKAAILGEDVTEYLELKYKLALLNASVKGSTISSSAILYLLISILFLMFLVFGGVALGFYISSVLESKELGFLITAIIFLFIAVICIAMKSTIIHSLKNLIVSKIYEKD